MVFNPQQIAEWTEGEWHFGKTPLITGFAFDARDIRPGECFIALSQGVRDGHDFVSQAFTNGASAAIVERIQPDQPRPQLVVPDSLLAMGRLASGVREVFSGPVIGITGSSGKTSTKEMLYQILGTERTHATAGNWNNRIGVPMTLFDLDSEIHDFAVIEAGINQPGEMEHLGKMIAPDLCLVTHIGPAHLELLGSLDGVAHEKSQLFRSAKSKASLIAPYSVFKYDAFRGFADRAIVLAEPGDEILGRTLFAEFIEAPNGGTVFKLHGDGFEGDFRVQSKSSGICRNAALAAIAGHELGIDLEDIKERIDAWRPADSRGQLISQGSRVFYVDCYNANPASMADSLLAFERTVPESLCRCYVLGAMNELGDGAVEWHQKVSRKIEPRPKDFLCLIGPDELIEAYASGAEEAGWDAGAVHLADSLESLDSIVSQFEGAVFLKGSRSYGLEKLLSATTN